MTTVYLCPTFGVGYQAFDTNGLPLNQGTISTYIAGGTTPQATYTTVAGSVQNANPIVLGTDGRPPNEIWLLGGTSYRFDVKDSLGNLIKSYDNITGIDDFSALSASSGSSLVGFIQAGTGAVARTVQAKERDIVSVLDFGTGIDGAAIQLAINAVVALGGGIVYMPGHNNFDVTVPLNLVNLQNTQVTLKGSGHGPCLYNTAPTSGANLHGLTGTQAVIETQGSHFVTLEDFGIYSLLADANKADVGIFIGRTTVQNSAQFHNYSRVFVTLASRAAANATRGTIALYNVQGEHGVFDRCQFASDTPLELSDSNALTYVPTYGTLSSVTSCTVNGFRNVSFLALTNVDMELRGIMSTTFLDCYYGTISGGNLNTAVLLGGGSGVCADVYFLGGQAENWNQFIEFSDAVTRHVKIDLTWADNASTGALILVNQANNQTFYGLDAHFWNSHATALRLIDVGAVTGVIGYGCHLVLDNGESLSSPTLKLLGSTIDDWNVSLAVISLAAGSTYTLLGQSTRAWTPGIAGSAGSGPATYTVQTGTYSLIGDRCFFQGTVTWTANGTFSGSLSLTGLPFISATLAGDGASIAISAATLPGFTAQLEGLIVDNANTILIQQFAAGVTTAPAIPATGSITISGNYRVG